jgi:hypothetical protein
MQLVELPTDLGPRCAERRQDLVDLVAFDQEPLELLEHPGDLCWGETAGDEAAAQDLDVV